MEYRIALVDDDTTSLANIRALLSERGMKVCCLKSGNDLLKYIENHKPDLILMDVVMPEMDGFETFNKLRYKEEQLNMEHIPVIFLTGESDIDAERRGLRLGASDFIHKPINQDIITRRIHNTITNNKTIVSLTEEASIDKLTGLYNKSFGTERISEAISDVIREVTGALIMFDLDNFKLVNDLFGHDMGDKVLSAFSEIMRKNTRDTDIISRIGGDEFLGLFREIREEAAVASLTERLNNELFEEAKLLMGEDFDIPLGISVGAVMIPEEKKSYEVLFDMADSAMYSAKQAGKHRYAVFSLSDERAEYDSDDLPDEINRISRIMEERNDEDGAFILGADAFAACYRFIMRQEAIHDRPSVKLLFALVSDESDAGVLAEAIEQFGIILQGSLRRSDIIHQNRPGRFFVLLPEVSKADVEKVCDRIRDKWGKTQYSDKIRVEYATK